MSQRTTRRLAAVLAVACCALVTTLPAQQPGGTPPSAAAPQAGEAGAYEVGPRLGREWGRVEPRIDGATAERAAYKAMHTIRVSTLVLVLCVVILVLLIA